MRFCAINRVSLPAPVFPVADVAQALLRAQVAQLEVLAILGPLACHLGLPLPRQPVSVLLHQGQALVGSGHPFSISSGLRDAQGLPNLAQRVPR